MMENRFNKKRKHKRFVAPEWANPTFAPADPESVTSIIQDHPRSEHLDPHMNELLIAIRDIKNMRLMLLMVGSVIFFSVGLLLWGWIG